MPFERDIRRTRNPFEIYLLALSLVSTAPLALGFTRPPTSLSSELGVWARVWGIALCIGSLVALVGIMWRRPKNPIKFSVTGLVVEQVGLVAVGGATIYYATAILLLVGNRGLVTSGIVLAYGAAAATQAWRIHRFLRGLEP